MYVVAINAIARDTNTVKKHRKPIYWNVLQAEDITQTFSKQTQIESFYYFQWWNLLSIFPSKLTMFICRFILSPSPDFAIFAHYYYVSEFCGYCLNSSCLWKILSCLWKFLSLKEEIGMRLFIKIISNTSVMCHVLFCYIILV